jgi:hypothetical protein
MTNQEDVRCVIFRKEPEQRKRQQRNLVAAVTRNQVKDVPSALLVNIIVPCIVRETKYDKAGDCPVCGMDLVKAP